MNGAWANFVTPLSPHEVQILDVDLDVSDDAISSYFLMLSRDERARAAQFRFGVHRNRFIVARAALRCLLGHFAQCSPSSIQFAYGSHGKPRLQHPTCPVSFNVSHTAGIALMAFALQREVGVDIEQVQPVADVRELAKLSLDCNDRAAIDNAPREFKTRTFYEKWVRKEAQLKLLGAGLAGHDLCIVGNSECCCVCPAPTFLIHSFSLGPDYAAAVAATGKDWNAVLRKWLGFRPTTDRACRES